MPSQKQLKWSQLKVGLTVLVASITLAVLIFLMSGTGGFFTPKITLKAYFDNASGLRSARRCASAAWTSATSRDPDCVYPASSSRRSKSP